MSTIALPSTAVTPARRASRSRRILHGVAIAASSLFLLGAVGYATIPAWFPADWLAARIAGQLSHDLRREVRFAGASLSWTEGVTLRDLRIGTEADAASQPRIEVERIHCDLTPVRTMWRGTVDQIEISGATAWLRAGDDGQIVGGQPASSSGKGRLPSNRFILRDLTCHIRAAAGSQTVHLDGLDIQLDPPHDRVHVQLASMKPLSGEGGDETDVATLMGEADLFLLRKPLDGRRVASKVRLAWNNLSLADLPIALIPRLPFRQVAGLTEGDIVLEPQADEVTFELRVGLAGVQLMTGSGSPPTPVPDTRLRTTGRWTPARSRITLAELQYVTSAVEFHGSATPAVAIDPGGATPFRAQLTGSVRDWDAVQRELPEIGALIRGSGADLRGGAEFTLDARQEHQQDRIHFALDAARTACVLRAPGESLPILQAGVDVPKSLLLEALHDRRTQRVSQSLVTLRIADTTVTLRSDLPVPSTQEGDRLAWLERVWPSMSGRLAINIGDLRRLAGHLPAAAHVAHLEEVEGSLRVVAEVQPSAGRSRVGVAIQAPEGNALQMGDWFHKRAEDTLDARLDAVVPHEAARLDLQGAVAVGSLRATLEPATLEYRVWRVGGNPDDNPAARLGVDAALSWLVRLSNLEAASTVFPRLARLQEPVKRLAGGATLRCRTHVSRLPDDLLVANQVEFNAAELTLDGPIRKPGGEPLRVQLDHRYAQLAGRREHAADLDVQLRGARLTGQVAFAGLESEDLSDDFEQAHLLLDVTDARSVLSINDELAKLGASLGVAGGLRVELESVLSGDWQKLTLQASATDTALTIPGEIPLDKPAGMPASIDLSLTGAASAARSGGQLWSLDHGRARLGGVEVASITGRLETAAGAGLLLARRNGGLRTPFLAPQSPSNLDATRASEPLIRSASLHTTGRFRLDDALAEWSQAIRRVTSAYHLSGECAYALDVKASGERLDFSGSLDGRQASFAVDLQQAALPMLRKLPASPLQAGVRGSLVREDNDRYTLALDDASLTTGAGEISSTGTLDLHGAGMPRLDRVDVTSRVRITDPRQLDTLLPGSEFRLLDGKLAARARVTAEANQPPRLVEGQVDFNNVTLRTPLDRVKLDGVAVVDDRHVSLDQLKLVLGATDATLSGDVRVGDTSARGQIGIACEKVDVSDLQRRLSALESSGAASRDPNAPLGGMGPLIDFLRGSNFNINTAARTLLFQLPLNVTMAAEETQLGLSVDRGNTVLKFRCLVDGGVVDGSVTTDLKPADPSFHLDYVADRIQPGPLVDQYLALTFPGMKASGPLTLIDETYQKWFPAPGELNYPVGKGEIIIGSGVIAGRAAPDWMIKIFPGLNFSSFDFSYFHDWFNKTIDGRIRHQMIYQGKFYNVYTVGYSMPDGRIDYEVGIDFLADFDSKYWADSGQGRIPLFRKTGIKQPDGKLADEEVTYTQPQRILDALLLKNNPAVTAYHAVRKRVLREK